jgi:hypothetical protein
MNAQQSVSRLAAVLGGAACPFLYAIVGDWAILFAGFLGGTGAIAFTQLKAYIEDKGRLDG